MRTRRFGGWPKAFAFMAAELCIVLAIYAAIHVAKGDREPNLIIGQPTLVAAK